MLRLAIPRQQVVRGKRTGATCRWERLKHAFELGQLKPVVQSPRLSVTGSRKLHRLSEVSAIVDLRDQMGLAETPAEAETEAVWLMRYLRKFRGTNGSPPPRGTWETFWRTFVGALLSLLAVAYINELILDASDDYFLMIGS
eukprot:CAMPEP_0118954044 /NCGR_PEP_ID=MMETSP1169-20130426/57605_1 /TAXON_ID=36882 /ORGANISM="Pyramimonas obovata, Strain CCMP722" /LENGTH=141 /DNA_ID=CAMNT_0006901615 /DNA_START=1 /DNA_END=422 /DNA_ORIENTATION=+